MESIRELTGAEVASHYAIASDVRGARLAWVHAAGATREQVVCATTGVTGLSLGTTAPRPARVAYDPNLVEPVQRNAPMTLADMLHRGVASEEGLIRVRDGVRGTVGLQECDQLRVVLCEGPSMLSYLGLYRGAARGAFGLREKRVLTKLVPVLVERLELEARVSGGGQLDSTLEATLEALGQPAWVVDASGRVLHANRSGEALLTTDRAGLCEQLRLALTGAARGVFRVAPLRASGLSRHSLVVARGTDEGVEARLRDRAVAWGVRPRGLEVLRRVVKGLSNVAIARELRITERTVEVHVSGLLEVARVENRSSLIAAFYGRG
jgi:DNA-binding CsgD family transcriptional regulator